jgi:hypothetical protein
MALNAALRVVTTEASSALPEVAYEPPSRRESLGNAVFATFLEMLAFNHKEMAAQEAEARARCERAVESLRAQLDGHPQFGAGAVDEIVQQQVERAREVFARELEQDVPTLAKAYEDKLRNLI